MCALPKKALPRDHPAPFREENRNKPQILGKKCRALKQLLSFWQECYLGLGLGLCTALEINAIIATLTPSIPNPWFPCTNSCTLLGATYDCMCGCDDTSMAHVSLVALTQQGGTHDRVHIL